MELATGDDATDEPAAPAAFPTAAIAPTPIRTATFTVERPDALRGPQKYEVTSDFENGISRVVIDRGDAPDVEVLTLFDQAVIRRVDQPNWYRLDRGAFPVGLESGRIRWIRTIDELIPPLLRGATTISEATESTVGTEPARRLVLTIDPAAITQASATAPVLPPGITLEPGTAGVGAVGGGGVGGQLRNRPQVGDAGRTRRRDHHGHLDVARGLAARVPDRGHDRSHDCVGAVQSGLLTRRGDISYNHPPAGTRDP